MSNKRKSEVNVECRRKTVNWVIIWLRVALSAGVIACFLWFTKQNIDEFRTFPTSTVYSRTRGAREVLPDLILCNSVKHDKYKLAQAPSWRHLPDLDQDVFNNIARNFGQTEYETLNRSYYVFGLDELEDGALNYVAERRFDLTFLIEATLGNLTSRDTQLDDFIVECWYESVNCSSWFHPFTSLSHGTCFNLSQKFVPDFEPVGKLQTGYQVLFYRNPLKASGIVEPVGGVSVTITEDDHLMVPEVESMTIPWGQGLEVKLQRLEYSRVTNCTHESSLTEDLCSFNCLDTLFVENCGCGFSPYNKSTTPCTPDQQKMCLPAIQLHWHDYLSCKRNCDTPCDWKGYSGQLSHFNFPSESFVPYLLLDILDNKPHTPTARSIREYFQWWASFTEHSSISPRLKTHMMLQNARSNFAYLHIFLGNNKEVIQEDYIISKWTIFSNIGGNVGIWLGLSAFNLVDVLLKLLKAKILTILLPAKRKSLDHAIRLLMGGERRPTVQANGVTANPKVSLSYNNPFHNSSPLPDTDLRNHVDSCIS